MLQHPSCCAVFPFSPLLNRLRAGSKLMLSHGGLVGVFVLFLIVGTVTLDDYGIPRDARTQRDIALANLNYILGDRDARFAGVDQVYGMAFELPLVLAERALGLSDTRAIHLSRHFLTHLLFLIAGVFCYGLIYRMFGSRLLALAALLLFWLHPRLYAHSFFNSKDIPFLSLFMIALFLLYRAFRKDTVGAFILCGVAVGALTNIRVMGIMLFPAVIAMRAADLWFAGGGPPRKHILLTGGLFALSGVLVYVSVSPFLWDAPGTAFRSLILVATAHPTVSHQLFRGELILASELPPDYIPHWFAVTTPPLAQLLGIVGIAAVAGAAAKGPGAAFRNTDLRFQLLTLAGLILPVLTVIGLGSTTYDGWRHLYFIYVPGCLLAVWGVRWLATAWARPARRVAVYGVAGAGVGAALLILQITQLHPYQNIYFNFLVDRTTPEYLTRHYDLDFQETSWLQGLEYLLEQYPQGTLYVRDAWDGHANLNLRMLPAAERHRIAVAEQGGQFQIESWLFPRPLGAVPETIRTVHTRKVYNSSVMKVYALDLSRSEQAAAAYLENYRSITAGEPVVPGTFDLYLQDNILAYTREPCAAADTQTRFSLHLFPVYRGDLPPERRQFGFDNRDFDFERHGLAFAGSCFAAVELPDYPLAEIETGQGEIWRVRFPVDNTPLYRAAYPSIVAGEPLHRAAFNLYLRDNQLHYVKEQCQPADTANRFFLHLLPEDVADLPAARQEHGVDNLDFDFTRYGAQFDGKCLATIRLPDYPIAGIRTGQFVIGGERLWETEFVVGN